jgi:hypothetical protein
MSSIAVNHEPEHNTATSEEFFESIYAPSNVHDCETGPNREAVLIGEYTRGNYQHRADTGLLGSIRGLSQQIESNSDKSVFLDVSKPLCMICVGVQGAGKSHTSNVFLETCMLPCDKPTHRPLIELHEPMCGLVLHYDQSDCNVCEATGLATIHSSAQSGVSHGIRQVVVYVSPTFYEQRKRFYDKEEFEVRPLLFRWSSLNAKQLKTLMRFEDQLYGSVMLNLLRVYQRKEEIPNFEDFKKQIQAACNCQGQSGPLKQRLDLLDNIIYESDKNQGLRDNSCSLQELMEPGVLVIADLTDPLLSAEEVNGIFQILLEQFRQKPMDCGKVLACDEAHKYLSTAGSGRDELANTIVDAVRLMRHEGMRILISTQSPLGLPPELLELVSVLVLHSFQSRDWYQYLSSKVHMPANVFERAQDLLQGQALLLSSKTDIRLPAEGEDEESMGNCKHCLAVNIRRRLTVDYGSSRVNKKTAEAEEKEEAEAEEKE